MHSLANELDSLVAQEKIFAIGGYYLLVNDASLVERRVKGNERAVSLLTLANRIGKRLYTFPFVRAVGISGSLSKDYADDGSDIDFFIITERNYLWLARTFLHGLKKISFLAGKQDWFCMNYFVDEDALTIAEKNIFTATEIVTLKTVAGVEHLEAFRAANCWVMDFFPNRNSTAAVCGAQRDHWFKRWLEKLFRNRMGSALDNYLMRVTSNRWRKKELQKKLNSKGNLLALVADKHFARPNPEHFQRVVLAKYEEKLSAFQPRLATKFSS